MLDDPIQKVFLDPEVVSMGRKEIFEGS